VTSRAQVEVRVRATATALAIFPYVFGDAGRRAAAAAGPPGPDGRPGRAARTGGPDGRREVTLTFEEERVAAHRLAGFGGQAEVIGPEAVRAELIAGAAELLARYRGELPAAPLPRQGNAQSFPRTGSCFTRSRPALF
jgi:WYL domain-containing protein